MLDNLSKLTILIPSYERQDYLDRQADFWGNSLVQLEILDGSAKPWERAKELPKNISYWHIPDTIEKRFAFGASRLDREYGVLLSDDEFFLPSALAACIDRLAHSPDMVSCKGLAIGFEWADGHVAGFEKYPELRGYLINQPTERNRMIRHMNPYSMATLWAVMKTDVFKKTLKAMSLHGPFQSSAAAEIQTSLVAAWSGECTVIDELMWLRSYENRSIWQNVWRDSGRITFDEWYRDERNEEETEKFIDAIQHSIRDDSSDEAQMRNDIKDAVNSYLQFCSAQESPKSLPKKILSLILRIPRKLNAKLRIALAPHRLKNQSSNTKNLLKAAKDLAQTGVHVNFDQLTEIEAVITKFHSVRSREKTELC